MMEQDTDNLAGLSPEELAALNDDVSEDAADADALKAIADDEVADDEVADDEVADEATAEEAEVVGDFLPTQAVYAVDDFDNKMAEFKAAKSDLRNQLNNGDIDLDQYEAGKDEIADKETTLRIQQANAENAFRQNDHIAAERWKWEQDQFFSAEKNAAYKDKIIMAALNAAVIDLANDPKHVNQKGAFFLNEADRIVRERFGVAANNNKQQSRKPDLTKIPKTLSNLPSADTEQSGEGEFASIEKLSGLDLERAVAKLSPEQVERYRTT